MASIGKRTFREDLYYRLNVIPIHIPPLRERVSDIPLLLDHFQKRLVRRINHYRHKQFSQEVLELMAAYAWPGNIRELENLMERISVLVEGDVVTVEELPDHICSKAPCRNASSVMAVFDSEVGFSEAVDQYQRTLITHALEKTGWIKARAAELLKMNRTTLVEKIKKMNIEPQHQGPIL